MASVTAAGGGVSARAATSSASSAADSGSSSSTTAVAGPPHAVGEAADAFGRGRLIRPVGGEHEHPPPLEVVREEDGQVDRRCVRPVQVLEHEQHRGGGGPCGQRRQHVLEHPQPRAARVPRLLQRTERVDERLVRELRADDVDRAADEHLESELPRASARAPRRVGTSRCPPRPRRGPWHRIPRAWLPAPARLRPTRVRVRRTPLLRGAASIEYRAAGPAATGPERRNRSCRR